MKGCSGFFRVGHLRLERKNKSPIPIHWISCNRCGKGKASWPSTNIWKKHCQINTHMQVSAMLWSTRLTHFWHKLAAVRRCNSRAPADQVFISKPNCINALLKHNASCSLGGSGWVHLELCAPQPLLKHVQWIFCKTVVDMRQHA